MAVSLILSSYFECFLPRHMVVIFTRLDALRRHDKSVTDYIYEIKEQRSDIADKFFSRSGEYVAFDNRPGHQTGNEARELIEAVERTLAANEHRHFTNETYEEIVEKLKFYDFDGVFNEGFKFESRPAQISSAIGIVAGLGVAATGVGGPVAGIIGIFATVGSYILSRKGTK